LQALDNMLTYIKQHTDVWSGVTYWAGGPWWGPYMFSIEPQNGIDKPQMGILVQHLASHSIEGRDFNGDGKSDILWQHDSGLPWIWTMDGTTVTGSTGLPNPGPTWHVVEAADFNGDSKSDILWQHDS